MARITNSIQSSSNYGGMNRQLSSHSVDSSKAFVKAFTIRRTVVESSGIPEVPSGNSSPPQSPPLVAIAASQTRHSETKNARRRGGAAFTITEECERLFCETLKTTFLGEGDLDLQNSLVMGMPDIGSISNTTGRGGQTWDIQYAVGHGTPDTSPFLSSCDIDAYKSRLVTDWLEMYDYAGGARFRGFIADHACDRSMFVFFDQDVLGSDLKPGLMALLELCTIPEVDCSKLVVCVDRNMDTQDSIALLRDLGWVGFETATLDEWSNGSGVISDSWMLLSMET